jgi:hypothetical protein
MKNQRCSAHSSRTGEQCKRYAIAGGTVCPTHGGSAPQVKRKAAERLAALIDPAIDAVASALDDPDPRVRLQGAREILNRALIENGDTVENLPTRSQVDAWLSEIELMVNETNNGQ